MATSMRMLVSVPPIYGATVTVCVRPCLSFVPLLAAYGVFVVHGLSAVKPLIVG